MKISDLSRLLCLLDSSVPCSTGQDSRSAGWRLAAQQSQMATTKEEMTVDVGFSPVALLPWGACL